jgi:hypothetical protein
MNRSKSVLVHVWNRFNSFENGEFSLPLTESVSFKAKLQKANRIQIPRIIRWQYKLEPTQVLKVTVSLTTMLGHEEFLARMSRDGRITVPKLTANLLRGKKETLLGRILEVSLEPA